MMNEFEIQRQLITLEETLREIKSSFEDHMEPNSEPMVAADKLIGGVRDLQVMVREWFAP